MIVHKKVVPVAKYHTLIKFANLILLDVIDCPFCDSIYDANCLVLFHESTCVLVYTGVLDEVNNDISCYHQVV